MAWKCYACNLAQPPGTKAPQKSLYVDERSVAAIRTLHNQPQVHEQLRTYRSGNPYICSACEAISSRFDIYGIDPNLVRGYDSFVQEVQAKNREAWEQRRLARDNSIYIRGTWD